MPVLFCASFNLCLFIPCFAFLLWFLCNKYPHRCANIVIKQPLVSMDAVCVVVRCTDDDDDDDVDDD